MDVRVVTDEDEEEEKKPLLLVTKLFALPEMEPLEVLRFCFRMGLRTRLVEFCESRVVACSDAMKPSPSILSTAG